MVIGSDWSKVHILCGNHGEDISHEMIVHDGAVGMSSFYSCPKYISNLKPEEGISCYNRLYVSDFVKMIEIIDNERYTDDGQIQPVKGFKFSIKRTEFHIIEEKKDELWIKVLNKKAVQPV